MRKLFALMVACMIPWNAEALVDSRLQKMPKAELHLHLGGAYPIDYLLSIAEPQQKEALQRELERISKSVPYHECFSIFGIVSSIVNTEEKIERGVEALCHSLERDGVLYAEIRTSIKDLGNGFEEYLKAVLRGIQRGQSENLHVRLLLSLQRSSSLAYTQATVALALKYRNQGVVGLDISGDSTIGKIQPILPEILKAKNEGLFLTLHVGESPLESGQIELLQAISPHRVGHGVHLAPDARNWIIEKRIPLEVCLTSSVLVRMVDQAASHPGLGYFLQKHPIALCTDDPLIFQTSLSQEYATFLATTPLSSEELKLLTQSSIQHAFISDQEKQGLLLLMESKMSQDRDSF